MTKVILISGKAGHGKDTFATFLHDQLTRKGQNVCVLHFADLVKIYAKEYFNWNGEKDTDGRNLLQKIGNNTFRVIDNNYWAYITAIAAKAMYTYFNYDYVLIPDNRYPNEIEIVQQYNANEAKTIHIKRVDENNLPYNNVLLTSEQKLNMSEIALDDYTDFDLTLGHSSLDELESQAQKIALLLLQRNF